MVLQRLIGLHGKYTFDRSMGFIWACTSLGFSDGPNVFIGSGAFPWGASSIKLEAPYSEATLVFGNCKQAVM